MRREGAARGGAAPAPRGRAAPRLVPLVVAVIQRTADDDPAPALATVAADRRIVLRPAALAAPAPAETEIVETSAGDRLAAAVALHGAHRDALVVVLEPEERITSELAAALRAVSPDRVGGFAAPVRWRFLGREVPGEPITLAWLGMPTAAPATRLGGALERIGDDLTVTVARLNARTSREATAGDPIRVRDLTTRPATRLLRRLVRRRRAGVPGLVLSIVETYGEVLRAAKAWERSPRAAPPTPSWVGRTPVGFRILDTPRGIVLLRADVGRALERTVLAATPTLVDGEPIDDGGRGGAWRVAAAGESRAVLRWYRRGGAFRFLVRDRYWGRPPRPLAELEVTEDARRRGVPAAAVVGVRVDRLAGGAYRGLIVTAEIAGATTLATALAGAASSTRAALLLRVGAVVRLLHDRGVHHRDLNARNILVRATSDGPLVHLIDFDRARILRRLSTRRRRRALRRLGRSLAKLARAGVTLTDEERAALARGYGEAE